MYFNGPKPRGILWLEALRGTFEIAHLAGECGGETPRERGIRRNVKESVKVVNNDTNQSGVLSAFRGMNLGAMHRKKRSFSILARCGASGGSSVEFRRAAVEEMRVLV